MGATTVNVAFSDDRDTGLTWAKDDPRRKYHVLYMTTSPEKALGSTLAHEMVHVVFATKFPHPNRMPAWVEEGVAARYDNEQRRTIRAKVMASFIRAANWPRLEEVLRADSIPATQQETYAVAVSLTNFLVSRRDKKTLIEFGQHARDIGWDAALQKHYRFRDVGALQVAWQSWARQVHVDGGHLKIARSQASGR